MTAISGAATKISTRTAPATWRRIWPMRPSAASWLIVGNSAIATLTPMIPTGSWLSWNA